MARFPTIEALAASDEQDVLAVWEGLGYYARARHLHAAAQRIVAEHGGRVPDDPEALAALDRMGAYLRTLTAIQVEAATTNEDVLEDGQKIQYTGVVP